MRFILCYALMALYFFSGCNQPAPQPLSLPAIFGDNMVLQQMTSAPFWGKTAPETSVRIKASWNEEVETTSDINGAWKVDVKTPKAGGPYHVAISSQDSTFHINNVLIGEVWLCSGQSNMEMPLKGWPPNEPIENSNQAIRSAHFPELRFFTVERELSTIEQKDLVGNWESCNPRTASYFSATAFYFGRKIHQELKVPVGLIHSSWGGSPVEAWTKGKDIVSVSGFEDVLNKLETAIPQQKAYEEWLDGLEQIDVSEKNDDSKHIDLDFWDDELKSPELDFSQWPKMTLPVFWEETDVGNFDGVIWFRKNIQIPENWTGRTLIIELAFIDDMDRTYINGHLVGGYESIGFWNAPRRYDLAAEKNTATSLSVAVRVIDTGGGGGIYGSAERMRIYPENDPGSAISVAGEWSYLVSGEYRSDIYYKYGKTPKAVNARPPLEVRLDHQTPTVLFNGMIAPIVPFSMKGVIWYQGEANVNNPEAYSRLFPAMIDSWRQAWNNEKMPFYFVQIAPFIYSGENNTEAAELREVQRLVNRTVNNTGMAVTLDLGSLRNIHPPKKKEVGERLAIKALQKTYTSKHLPYCGPVINDIRVEGNTIQLTFRQVRSGLQAVNGKLEGFEVAGPDGIFKNAKAAIKGEAIIIENPVESEIVTVRYAFRNGSVASLFNMEGFPASTFEISNEAVPVE